jgi:hypothetical protein
MDSSATALDLSSLLSLNASIPQTYNAQAAYQHLVLQASFSSMSGDAVNISLDFSQGYKSIGLSAQKIVDKLNEMLKDKLPDGIQSLKPEDVTPDATSDRIVKSITALFDAYAKQHPELEGQDLVDKFLELAKKGVDQGYNDAFSILKGLGAFEFDGVQAGIEKTKELIGQKLDAFREFKLKELGLDNTSSAVSSTVKDNLLSQGGSDLPR